MAYLARQIDSAQACQRYGRARKLGARLTECSSHGSDPKGSHVFPPCYQREKMAYLRPDLPAVSGLVSMARSSISRLT